MFGFLSKSKRAENRVRKISKPSLVNQAIGRELILTHSLEPDLAWSLMQVAKHSYQDSTRYEVRVFSAKRAADRGVAVTDFNSLDNHPDLVLYHGWYVDKNQNARLIMGPDVISISTLK